MIKISRLELYNLEKIGHGCLSTVYKKDDNIAYKIYRSEIPVRNFFAKEHRLYKNPCLKLDRIKFRLLKDRASILKYTDLFQDIIYVDGKFYGVSIPLYNGITLEDCLDKSFSDKIDISSQLIRNCNELINNYIYPIDLKLSNVMVVDDTVKIIDLDDPETKVTLFSNYYYKKKAFFSLNQTIFDLFQESDSPFCYSNIFPYLERKKWDISNDPNFLNDYLKYKKDMHDYLIISNDSDLNYVREINKDGHYRMLYKFNCAPEDYKYLENVVVNYLVNGIPLFDFVDHNNIEGYFNNFNEGESFEVFNQTLVKRKK